ncbi:S8 family serine peptidase [Sphaerisporangium perillae]|uniref:S8 family serine peptidase n=1 Tax=Sphaerisporangium perillae TaxID=2935860 RepID=UPI00243507F9|nr:S8 family serine peptidase [Sphaerisporangium perillae]
MLRQALTWVVAASALVSALASPAAAEDVLGELARDLQAAHKVAKGRGVTIAMLADGVDPGLRELAGRLRVAPDLVRRTESDQRAGTLLASMITGKGSPQGTPIKGIAPSAKILSVRVRPSSASAYKKFTRTDSLGKLAQGIRYAADHGAKVIFIGDARGDGSNTRLVQAVNYAVNKKVVMVSAASRLENANGQAAPLEALAYPAAIPGVIAVGATDNRGRWLSKLSGRNSTVTVAAPGTRVNATGDGNRAGWYIIGPDVAAAWVVGTAALIKEQYPNMSPGRVAQALALSTRHRPKGGYSTTLGNGLVSPIGALKEAKRLNKPAGAATAGKGRVGKDAHFGGGLPATPVKAVKWDEAKLTRYGLIAGAGLLLFLISLVTAAVAMVRRRGKRRAPATAPIPSPEHPYGPPQSTASAAVRPPQPVWPDSPPHPRNGGQDGPPG